MVTSTNDSNWKQLFQDVVIKEKIPSTASSRFTSSSVTVRDLFVDIDVVYNDILNKLLDPSIIRVYADVVRFSSKNPLVANNVLFISARRIEVSKGVHILLDYREKKVAKFIVCASEIYGKLEARAVLSTKNSVVTKTFDLSVPTGIITAISFKNDNCDMENLKVNNIDLDVGAPMRMSLGSIFQLASIWLYSKAEIATTMLKWIKKVTDNTKNGRDLYLQSSNLLVFLENRRADVTFVPPLNKNIYITIFNSFLDVAKNYETQYYNFIDKVAIVRDRKEAGNLMLEYFVDVSDVNAQLIKQTEKDYEMARQSLTFSKDAFEKQKRQVELASITFESERENWIHKETIKAVFDIALGVLEFIASVGLMIVGDEAAAPKAANAIEQVAQEGERLEKLANNMRSLFKKMKSLTEISASIEKIIPIAKEIQSYDETNDIKLPEVSDSLSEAEWKNFSIENEASLQPAINKGIPGSSELLTEIKKLSNYALAFITSQNAVISTGQALAKLYLEKKISWNQKERWQKYIDQLTQDEAHDEVCSQISFDRLLDIKRCLSLALLNYSHAYKYWALAPSEISPGINKTVSQFLEDRSKIDTEFAIALNSFNPAPQKGTFTIDLEPNVQKPLEENIMFSQTFNIDTEDKKFNGYSRVRVNTIRCWLQGATTLDSDDVVNIKIRTSGVYEDKSHKKIYKFASEPLERAFSYKVSNNQIMLDGVIEKDFRRYYFQPTAFTQWTIEVNKESNGGVNLSDLKSIRIELICSVTPSEN
ncbi:hypothetical protein C1646_758783 [Rhizophagus diaphanus]|nr:hypothetical protein C1646_758783 [Rhizophagus diaphanus] [Rhizophagus sp. MUCL 43196]